MGIKRDSNHRGGRLAEPAGFAVPTVLLGLVAAFGLATATIVASVGAESGSVRDQNTKAAFAAAEAGVSNALLRFNRIATTSASDACAPIGGTAVGIDGWCPTQATGAIDRGTYAYSVRLTAASGSTPAQLKVVSQGVVDGVSRRVSALADTVAEGYRPFAGLASVIGLDSIFMNANSVINADVATNGNIGLNTGSTLNCDYAQVGIGKGFSPNNGGTVTCPATQGTISLPPVNPGNVGISNSNSRICTDDPCTNAVWSPGTKPRLTLNSGGSIALGASGNVFDYAFCKLTLNANSYVYVAADATVRIYLLAPEVCSNESEPLVINSGSKIQQSGAGVANVSILIVGSATRTTSTIINADSALLDCNQGIVLYAPRTGVTLNSDTEICGGVAAKSIMVNADSTISASNAAEEFELPGEEGVSHYGLPHDYVECTSVPPPTGGSPDSGC